MVSIIHSGGGTENKSARARCVQVGSTGAHSSGADSAINGDMVGERFSRKL